MTIYSYYRISELETSLDSETLDSILEPELLSIQIYCLQQDWFMTKTVKDENCAWSEEFLQRENARLLFDQLEAGDILVCSQLERIVSSSAEVVRLIRKFRQIGVQLHIVDLKGDITAREFPVNFEKASRLFSSLEKRKSAERIRGVKQQQRKQGRYLGGSRPFGYSIHENGRLIEHPTEQKALRKIMELKRQGKSLRAISSAVSTPVMPVSFKTVQRLLQRHSDQL